MKLEGYEVYLESNGRRLRELGTQTTIPQDPDGEYAGPRQATCWVQSKAGQSLSIVFYDALHTHDMRGTLTIDGRLYRKWTSGTNEEKVYTDTVYTSPTSVAQLSFAERPQARENDQPQLHEDPTDEGSITICLQRGERYPRRDRKSPLVCPDNSVTLEPLVTPGIDHRVVTGPDIPVQGEEPAYHFEVDKHYKSSLFFTFYYRSEAILRSLGLAERGRQSIGGESAVSSPNRRAGPSTIKRRQPHPNTSSSAVAGGGRAEAAESDHTEGFAVTLQKRRSVLQQRYDSMMALRDIHSGKIDVLERLVAREPLVVDVTAQAGVQQSASGQSPGQFLLMAKAELNKLKTLQQDWSAQKAAIEEELKLLDEYARLEEEAADYDRAKQKKRKLSEDA